MDEDTLISSLLEPGRKAIELSPNGRGTGVVIILKNGVELKGVSRIAHLDDEMKLIEVDFWKTPDTPGRVSPTMEQAESRRTAVFRSSEICAVSVRRPEKKSP